MTVREFHAGDAACDDRMATTLAAVAIGAVAIILCLAACGPFAPA